MAQTHPISVVIVDDQKIVRETLHMLLRDEKSVTIIGDSGSGAEAVAKISILKPNIVLMDAAPPRQSGVDAATAIKRAGLSAKVILLTDTLGANLRLREVIDAGVMGYLLKDISKGDLLSAIEKAHNGAPIFHPTIQKQMNARTTGERSPHQDLTPRELDILKEIAKGKNNKTIAAMLNLTGGTVKGYVSVVLSKLGVDDRNEAALYAIEHGLLTG